MPGEEQAVAVFIWIWSSDVFWDRITSITSAGEQEVYGLQAEPNRNFVASGVIPDCPVFSGWFRRRPAAR